MGLGTDKAKRPRDVPGTTREIETASCGSFIIIVNLPWEVFYRMGNPGGCQNCWGEALARSISIGLRCGVPIEEYIEQLHDIKCCSPSVRGLPPEKSFTSCPDSISKVLQECIEPEDNPDESEPKMGGLVYAIRDNQSDKSVV